MTTRAPYAAHEATLGDAVSGAKALAAAESAARAVLQPGGTPLSPADGTINSGGSKPAQLQQRAAPCRSPLGKRRGGACAEVNTSKRPQTTYGPALY